MKILRQLPNALTLSNLLMGTIAIFCLMGYGFESVLYLFAFCLLADILDGYLARKLGVASGIGVQLDSLADVVSFGVLPAVLLYYFGMAGMVEYGPYVVLLYYITVAMVAASAGLRLARFNIDTRPREYFWGLPTPAGAVMVVGFCWSLYAQKEFPLGALLEKILLFFIPILLIIMYQVSLKLPGLKSPVAGKRILAMITGLAIVGLFFIGPLSISLGIMLYVLAGLINLLIKMY